MAAVAAASVSFAGRAGAQQADSTGANPGGSGGPCGACIAATEVGLHPLPAITRQDTTRPRAIAYSNGYYTRLTIHRIASYTELPLFVAEYFVGTKVLNDERDNPGVRSSLRGTHGMIASGLEGLFALNTVTGVWNLIEARHDPAGRTRRWLHSLTMLAADAGFVATAGSTRSARGGGTSANTHRAWAIGSMALATASTLMMWLWKN
ncbi:MAG TPA: hypothetical protein VID74_07525 [Gemmatimonadales bacterium]